jgi:putative hydrolase of the HAD superfamily
MKGKNMVFLFDLDDTLIDDFATKNHYMPRLYHSFKEHINFDEAGFYEAWRMAIPKYHKRFERGELSYEEQRIRRVRDAFGNWDLKDGFVADVLNTMDGYFVEGWTLFPDSIQTLEFLKGYKKGLITNGGYKQQRKKLDVLGIRRFFDCICISEENGYFKPDPRIFTWAADRLECPAQECYFIGNSWENDVLGSYRANMKPVWFNRYKKDVPEKLDGLIVIHELKDLENLL